MYFELINKLYKKHLPNNRKSFLSYNFVLQCESTLTKLNKIGDQITGDPEWAEALRKQKIVSDHHLNDIVLVGTL